jgi:hypothetical protein
MYEWDEAKRAINFAKHGVDFAEAEGFDWRTAVSWPDTRFDYGEERSTAVGKIGSRLHVMVFTKRSGRTRNIGLRKANAREVRRYAKAADKEA